VKKIVVLLLLAAILGTLLFAWGNSCCSIPESRAQSRGVMEVITPFLEVFVGKGNVTNHMVRKLAHFTEFSLLGGELYLFLMALRRNKKMAVAASLTIGLCAAATDEIIQIFFDRGSQVKDVVLDFAGVCTGVAVAYLMLKFFIWFSHRREKKGKTA